MEKWTRLLVIVATWLLLLAFVGAVIHLSTYIHHTLLLFALGALIAYALDPLVEMLRRTRLNKSNRVPSREFSVTVVFVGFFLLLGLAVWSLEGHLVHQVTSLQTEVTAFQQDIAASGQPHFVPTSNLYRFASSTDRAIARHGLHFSLVDAVTHPSPDLKAMGARAGREALPFLGHVFADLGESIIVLLIALYFLLFGTEMREKFNALLPPNLRERADLWETDVNRILGGFVRGQLIIALVIGAAAAVGCLLLGIHLWLLIGLFVVVASLIPVFGPYIGAIPAIVAALVGPTHFFSFELGSIASAVIILVWFIVINEVGSKVLYPKLVGAALGLHTVLVLFALFAGLEIGGVVGVLFAAPVTALAIVTVVHLYRFWQDLPDSLLSEVARREGRLAEREPGEIKSTAPDPAPPAKTGVP